MRREWAVSDPEAFEKEMKALGAKDESKILDLMNVYAASGVVAQPPVLVEDYGEGLLCLRHVSGTYKGRCLFFAVVSMPGYQLCVALKIYRKHSQKADPRAIKQARNRMRS